MEGGRGVSTGSARGKNVERYEVVMGDEITIFPAELTEIQTNILELLDVPIADYQ